MPEIRTVWSLLGISSITNTWRLPSRRSETTTTDVLLVRLNIGMILKIPTLSTARHYIKTSSRLRHVKHLLWHRIRILVRHTFHACASPFFSSFFPSLSTSVYVCVSYVIKFRSRNLPTGVQSVYSQLLSPSLPPLFSLFHSLPIHPVLPVSYESRFDVTCYDEFSFADSLKKANTSNNKFRNK